ncbi:hypothetical protein J2801_003625 [Paraburkholderia phenoliruptrix]|uniref:hypothetical protein n=1 Tax=Paraburkholderia phenoliruptrix TaxID=252970 RepID=UPI00285A0DA9|nr:hypothetical protein [Paraburkholderia phenoliruptrix]MDR6421337.1 hypothetical protein [Paraburkholderia phenoliruptrix]
MDVGDRLRRGYRLRLVDLRGASGGCGMKTLAGKRWFYSLGQRSMYIGYTGIWPQPTWPTWARLSFFQGQDHARWSKARQTVKTWPVSKLAEAA